MKPAQPKSDRQETIFEGSDEHIDATIAESSAETPTKGAFAGERVTPEAFAGLVSQAGLLSAEELDSFQQDLSNDDKPADADALAQLLIRRNKLTEYQARQLQLGKVKGLVFGNYIVLDELGKGGMGMVFKAYHRRMKRTVALKVLPPEMTNEPNALARFHREVEAAGKLTHANIAAAYDADEANGIHFMVMEFVDGPDLSAYVSAHGHLNLAQSLQLCLQAAVGLEHAHKEGVVHRDIKPSNLLVDSTGTLKVLDMGLAQLHRDTSELDKEENSDLTQSGRVLGTVDYMSPEQAMDAKRADYRADIYSLGCTLYFLLVGKAPAPEGTLTKKLLWHQNEEAPKLADTCPGISPMVEATFQQMLAKKPEDRQQSMGEVIDQLQACMKEIPAEEMESAALGLSVSADAAMAARRPGSTATALAFDATIAEPGAVSLVLSQNQSWSKTKVTAIATCVVLLLGVTYGVVHQLGASDRQVAGAGATGDDKLSSSNTTTPTAPGGGALPARKSQIILNIDQPSAVVMVDGKQLGVSSDVQSKPLALEVAAGKHELTITKKGFEDYRKPFTSNVGAAVEMDIKLTALPAVESSPAHKLMRWVIANQGTATLLDEHGKTFNSVRTLPELPADAFTVVGINLADTDVTDGELAPLAGAESLEDLSLSKTPVTDAGLKHLVGLRRLSRLDLAETRIGDAGMASLSSLRNLRELNLNNTRVTDRGLADVGTLRNLESLHLADTSVTSAGLPSLFKLSKLLVVSLKGADVSAQSIYKLGRALPKIRPSWDPPELDRELARKLVAKGAELILRTEDDKLEDGVVRLADIPDKEFYLEAITLTGNKSVTDADLAPLAGLEHLESIQLGQTNITANGLTALEKIASLKRIDLGALQLDKVAVERLTAAVPGRSVKWAPVSDRSVAEWILSQGGSVSLETSDGEAIRDVTDAKLLPAARFDVRVVHLEGIKGLKDADATRLIHLQRPAEVYFDKSPISDASLKAIAGMTTLHTLSLNETKVTDAGLANLAALTSLRRLFVSDTGITDEGLKSIRSLRGLTHMSLAGTAVTDQGLAHVARFTNLAWLNLSDTPVNDSAVSHLLSLKAIKTLMVDNTKLSDAGVEQLESQFGRGRVSADPPDPQRLAARWAIMNGGAVRLATGEVTRMEHLPRDACTVLGIDLEEQSKVVGKDLALLAACKRLESLNLTGTAVDDVSMAHLAGLTSLTRLTLDETRVSDAGIRQLKELTALETLSLGSTRVSGSGFVDLKNLTKLKHLKLSQTLLSDSALAYLKPFQELQSIDLSYNRQVTDRGFAHLAAHTQIRWLLLRGTQLTDAALPQIARYRDVTNLDLSSTKVTDALASQLSRLTKLTSLEVNSTGAGDSTLSAAQALAGLKALSMTKTAVSKEAAAQFRTARPKVQFSFSSARGPQERR